jgi:hypothetical protein
MNAATSYFSSTEFPGWPGTFSQKLNIIYEKRRKPDAPDGLDMQTKQCTIY